MSYGGGYGRSRGGGGYSNGYVLLALPFTNLHLAEVRRFHMSVWRDASANAFAPDRVLAHYTVIDIY